MQGAQRGVRSRRHDAARCADVLRQGRHAREVASTAPREISERHRHRYEFNNRYFDQLAEAGLVFLGFLERRPRGADRAAAHGPSVVLRHAVPPGVQLRIRATATRCSRASSARRARARASSCRESRAHEARGLRGRRTDPAIPDRRPVRHRERSARDERRPSGSKAITAKLAMPFVFKASFDKANRSSLGEFRGPRRRAAACAFSSACASELDVPVLTDVHEDTPLDEVAAVVDVLADAGAACAGRRTSSSRSRARASPST